MRVRGFAELTFRESARLIFARACERVGGDVTVDHPQAWVIDDRRISFAVEMEMSQGDLDAHCRVFEELVREATSGEVVLDAEGKERWARWAGHVASGVPDQRTSGTAPLDRVSAGTPSVGDDGDTDITAVRAGRRP